MLRREGIVGRAECDPTTCSALRLSHAWLTHRLSKRQDAALEMECIGTRNNLRAIQHVSPPPPVATLAVSRLLTVLRLLACLFFNSFLR